MRVHMQVKNINKHFVIGSEGTFLFQVVICILEAS